MVLGCTGSNHIDLHIYQGIRVWAACHGADFNKRLLLWSLFSIYIAPHNCLPITPQSTPVKAISISNPHRRGNKSEKGFRNIHKKRQNEYSHLGRAWTSLPLTHLASSFIPSFCLADPHRARSSRRFQVTSPEGPSQAALSKVASPPQGLHHHIPGFMDFTLCIVTEVILFVNLYSCLLSVFIIQRCHFHNSNSLSRVVVGHCIHPLCWKQLACSRYSAMLVEWMARTTAL